MTQCTIDPAIATRRFTAWADSYLKDLLGLYGTSLDEGLILDVDHPTLEPMREFYLNCPDNAYVTRIDPTKPRSALPKDYFYRVQEKFVSKDPHNPQLELFPDLPGPVLPVKDEPFNYGLTGEELTGEDINDLD